MSEVLSSRLGGPFSALGNMALGAGDSVINQTWPNNFIQGFKVTQRNFAKTVYNRFFSYKTTPRKFTFQVNRLDRATLDASRDYTEIGSGEVLSWVFDFQNVLLPGESISGLPAIFVYLKRQPIIVNTFISNVAFSGSQASCVITAGRNNKFAAQPFTSMLGQQTSVLGHIRLGDTPNNTFGATSQVAGLNVGGQYTLMCRVPLSSGRYEECILDFGVPA